MILGLIIVFWGILSGFCFGYGTACWVNARELNRGREQ